MKAAGVRNVDPRRGPSFTHTFLALQAAASGQGVAMATSVLIGDDLRAAGWCDLFGPEIASPYSYYLVCPPTSADQPKVQAFSRWIKAIAGRFPKRRGSGMTSSR